MRPIKLIVDIKVSDLKRAVIFYREVLGLVCRIEENEWAALTIGDAEIHLYRDGGTTGHVEFYVDDIEKYLVHLNKSGVSIIPGMGKANAVSIDDNGITTFPWGRALFFHDSEGNELAFVKDN